MNNKTSNRNNNIFNRMFYALFTLHKEKLKARLILVILIFSGMFLTLVVRLVQIEMHIGTSDSLQNFTQNSTSTARPEILDRNGIALAIDIKTASIFADPRKIIDKDEAAELINAIFPELDGRELKDKLSKKNGFVWIKREVTPKQQADIYRLGIPGLGFLSENKRIYPNGSIGSHALGFVNIDNIGIAGIEKYIDTHELNELRGAGLLDSKAELKPLELSLDVRITHAVREELIAGVTKYQAKAGAALILDVDSGEIIAHVSLPDYDPNNPSDALKPDNINRLQVGVYEMGSTFKALTTAMALDSGKIKLTSTFDASQPLRYGRFKINDYHGQHRALSVPEIFIHSSNIGTARMALSIGVEGHKAFLKKMGQLDKLYTELPETAEPIKPTKWGELNTMTIAFGHGLAVAPLQAAMATAALVNGGKLITPTYIKRSKEEAQQGAVQVISPTTSEFMRYVMRLNAEIGSATKADIPGYYLGAKTGTSEKVIGGQYSKTKLLTSFMAIMPADKPRYLLLIMLDEPKPLPETHGFATSGWNAAPVTGKIVARIGPMLGLETKFELPSNPFPLAMKNGGIPVRKQQ